MRCTFAVSGQKLKGNKEHILLKFDHMPNFENTLVTRYTREYSVHTPNYCGCWATGPPRIYGTLCVHYFATTPHSS